MRGSNAATDAGVLRGAAYATTDNLLDRGMAVTAVDLSEGMVAAAAAAGITRAGVADAQALPFPDRPFDRIVAAHMTGVFCCSAPR